jgi:hypothetical protein
MPKSTIQMSPGFAAGIFGFLFIHVTAHRVGGFVEKLRLVPFVQFAQPAADGGTLVVRQLGQFGKDFNRTHGKKLTLRHHTGKPSNELTGSAASLHQAKRLQKEEWQSEISL